MMLYFPQLPKTVSDHESVGEIHTALIRQESISALCQVISFSSRVIDTQGVRWELISGQWICEQRRGVTLW